jgi:tRNA-specific 2-thiouridylase
MKTWYPDWLECDWKTERRDAMRVCARLEIPFVEYDLGEAYFNEVGMNMINEYRAGRTPNPDVMCNKHVKFDAFWNHARSDGADLIATGHYARKGNSDQILMGIDSNKDQTYFLWGINPRVVPNILFPIGNTQKEKIRKEALKSNLITANKPDSQGICFLGQVDLVEFLSHYLTLEPGNVLDTSGNLIGTHQSAYVYTIGQRHGFTLNNIDTDSEPRFVIQKDVTTNTIVVGTKSELQANTSKDSVDLINTNWFVEPQENQEYQVRWRYRGQLIPARIIKNSSSYTVEFSEVQTGVAAGQSVVVYDDHVLVGGGIVK